MVRKIKIRIKRLSPVKIKKGFSDPKKKSKNAKKKTLA